MEIQCMPFVQEGVQMYQCVMSAKQLIKLAEVDVWKGETDQGESGYQRMPESARTLKVARYLKTDPKPLLPSSIVVSLREDAELKKSGDGLHTLVLPKNARFWIVDGQHRTFGLQRAIEELGVNRLSDYLLPLVIVRFQNKEDEANQFRVINETMKKVRTDLARRLLAMRFTALGSEGRRRLREDGRLWEANAVEVISRLTSDQQSPWFQRIQRPNERKTSSHVIRELSFSTSLKPILNAHPFRTWQPDRLSDLLKRYWQAWAEVMPEAFENPSDYVAQKTAGAFSLHQLFIYMMEVFKFRDIVIPSVDDFKDAIRELGQYAEASYWETNNSEGAAMAGSMKGFAILADALQEELEINGFSTQ